MKSLRAIFDGCPDVKLVAGSWDATVADITADSRAVAAGSLFVALKGSVHDGHDHLSEAVGRGASAVLVERPVECSATNVLRAKDSGRLLSRAAHSFFDDPSARLSITGVTGTNGKTTTTFLIRSILREAGRSVAVLGTVGYFIGDAFFDAPNTTPDALLLNRMLARCVSAGLRDVAMEVSSHALKLGRVEGIRFARGIFTNLTQDHLDFHPDMDDYFAAKSALFAAASQGAVNIDDEYGRKLREARPSLLAFGDGGSVSAEKASLSIHGTSFALNVAGERVSVTTRLVGRPNISNCLAAAAAAHLDRIEPAAIARGLAGAEPPRGRFELVPTGAGFAIAVDYAHTPDALERLLMTGRDLKPARMLVVFGCGGDRDRKKRPIMGRIAERLADEIWVTSDNPRMEDPEKIIAEIMNGSTRTCRRMVDRRAAIHDAVSGLRDGDLLLIAGKGHEDYQIIGRAKEHFDDREVAMEALGRRAGQGSTH